MSGYGAVRRPSVLPLIMAGLCGALSVLLIAIVLQRHTRPEVPRIALACFDARPAADAPEGFRKAAMQKKEPTMICEGISR